MKAIWKDKILAESDKTIVIENNHYFPAESLNMEFFEESSHTSDCPWKGHAKYYSVVVDGEKKSDSAWYYPEPFDAAQEIKGMVAFWKGIEIIQ